jgi:pimeloyl-ACP methyl ester carboxylesterase
MNHFTEVLGIGRYHLYGQDYGGPVGFRMAISHPVRLGSLIIQNAVAHDSGLSPRWQTRRAFWADRAAHESELRPNFISLEATRTRHLGTIHRPIATTRIARPTSTYSCPGRA